MNEYHQAALGGAALTLLTVGFMAAVYWVIRRDKEADSECCWRCGRRFKRGIFD